MGTRVIQLPKLLELREPNPELRVIQCAPPRLYRQSSSGLRLPAASRHSRLLQPEVIIAPESAMMRVAGTARDFFMLADYILSNPD